MGIKYKEDRNFLEKIKGGQISPEEKEKIIRTIAKRHLCERDFNVIGKIGKTYFIASQGLVVKIAFSPEALLEIWKNKSWNEFLEYNKLNKFNICENVGEFYIVMKNARGGHLAERLKNINEVFELFENFIKYLGDFFFENIKIKEKEIQNLARNEIKYIIDLSKKDINKFKKDKKYYLNLLTKIYSKLMNTTPEDIPITPVIPDAHISNFMLDENNNIFVIDQGWNLDFDQVDAKRAYWGLPHFSLGAIYESLKREDNIPDEFKIKFKTLVKNLIQQGYWDKNSVKTWKNYAVTQDFFYLGQLWHSISETVKNPTKENFSNLDNLIDNILINRHL